MNIIPELNLNKHPNVIKNNSIVHAENIKLSNDSAILENDKVYERNTEILYLLDEIYGDERLIEYVLSCNRELILFTRATINDNILDIIRYDEITNKAKRVIDNFKYNGGKLLGTFTYNENNLIIAISEYFEDDSKNIPLKTLNLGKFSDNINIINKFHTIIPEVKIPSVNYNIINGFSYKGWYNVFIRYKLDDYDYTQWYNTNCSFLLDEYNNNSIIDYTITKATAKNFTTDENLLQNYPTVIKLNQYVSENKKLITYTANLNVSNLDSNYKNYQLAFIISSKEDIVGYSTKDININKTNYTINIKNCTKLDVSTIIKSFYNYYNVKTLDSVNNRLYIGNYNESLLEIDSNYELDVELKASSSDIKKIYNDDSSYKYIKVDALDDTYKFEYNEIDGNAIIYAYDFFSYNVLDLANGSKNIEYHKLNKDDTINVTLMHGFGQGSYAEPLGIVSVKNLYYNIRTKEYYINGTVIQHNENENQRLVYTLDQDTNTFSKSYIPVCQDYTYTVEEESYTTLNVTKTILNNNFIYPEQYYSFYIIFVDKYGHNYKPLKINNSNTNLSLINDLVRTPIISTNNTLSFKCKLKTFPANFVGYYVAYEQFESTIKLQGFGNKIDNKLIFYSDAINYKDSISINFTHVKVYAVENDPLTNEQGFLIDNNYRVKLNTDDDGQPSYSIFTIENKLLHVADTGNNILNSSNIELTILEDTFLDYGNDLYYCELINDNISELYNDENKTLIPCSKICYNVEEVIEINTKNAFIGNISALVVRNYFDDATCTYRELDSTLPGEGVYLFNLKHYVEVPNESIIINNAPTVKMFLDYDKSVKDAYKYNYVPGRIVTSSNTIDLYKEVISPIYINYPKPILYNLTENYTDLFNKTFRRSNVIQDESNINAWRNFELEQYRNINENKGNIIKIIGIGKYFIVHTEHSMFLFNGTDTIKSNEGSIQLASVDIMNLSYQEVITSKLGYAGLQKEYHGIVGTFGYIFYSADDKRLYKYDNNQIITIDDSIVKELKNITDIRFGDDKENNRLFVLLIYPNNTKLLSYNYNINKFISIHTENTFNPQNVGIKNWDIEQIYFYSTKSNIYLVCNHQYTKILDNNEEGNQIEKDINTSDILQPTSYNVHSKSSIAIIHNDTYDLMKYLDNIIYKVNKINNDILVNTESPVEGKDIHYAADSLQIYSEHCDTGVINIDTSKNLNSPDNYMTPYWRFGNWHFNAIRNKITDDDLVADEKSKIFGNWFVVKFNFNTNQKVEIESLECKTSIAEY